MGYSTDFTGSIKIEPPLSEAERDYVNLFGSTRRMDRSQGPYHCGSGFAGQSHDDDILNYNRPPKGQPGLWCQWEVSEDGSELAWNQTEKFYKSAAWMAYLRSHFIVLRAARYLEPTNFGFLEPHSMSGLIHAVGENVEHDVSRLKVDAEGVWTSLGTWSQKAQSEFEVCDMSMSEAADLSASEGMVVWESWGRIEDYEDPLLGSHVQALAEREAMNGTTLASACSDASKRL